LKDDNPLWYDCEEEVRHKRPLSRAAQGARVLLVLALLAAASLAGRFLF
jgi:hypothetical protein